MKAIFGAIFHTDGDFSFRNFDKLFDKNNAMYKEAKIEYVAVHDYEYIHIHLSADGKADACRWAIRDLLEEMICSISTHKYYLVREIYDLLYYFLDGLFEDMNQDKNNYMSGNYDGTCLNLYIRED